MPCCSARCGWVAYKIQLQFIYRGITGLNDSRAALTRLLLAAASQRWPVQAPLRQPSASVGVRLLFLRRPNQLMVPVKERKKAQRTRQSPKVKNTQSKNLKLEVQNSPQSWIEAGSARQGSKQAWHYGNPKHKSEPKVCDKAGSIRWSRIST